MCLNDDFIKRLAGRLIESKSCYVTLLHSLKNKTLKDKLDTEIVKQLHECKEHIND